MNNAATEPVIFGENHLRIEDVLAVAQGRATVRLQADSAFRERIARGAQFLDTLLDREGVIYGVTTGYGDSCVVAVPLHQVEALPQHLFTFHGCGLGKLLDAEATRAVLAARLRSLTHGMSGVRIELLDRMQAFLEQDILPLIPEEGSVGASGDLTPLSYVAAALAGEREVMFRGECRSAAEVHRQLGWTPLTLRPKEALALMNGTAVMTGLACLAYARADYLLKLATRITALNVVALEGNPEHFDERLFAAKPHPGQTQVAAWIRQDLAIEAPAAPKAAGSVASDGAARRETARPRSLQAVNEQAEPALNAAEPSAVASSGLGLHRLQDRYSIRCAPHVLSVLADSLGLLRQFIETELNSANDNPIIDADNERVLHGGHFYGGHIAFAMDSLKNLVANVADLLDRQLALLVDTRYNHGLPSNLSGAPAATAMINHGFKAVQIGTSAWTAEALKNSMPASVFSRSTECHNQDKVSMGTIAARDALRSLELTEQVAAATLIAANQGVWLRQRSEGARPLPTPLHAMHIELGENFPPVIEDRALEGELRLCLERIRAQHWGLYA
jgi:histidine ammonia-lyase